MRYILTTLAALTWLPLAHAADSEGPSPEAILHVSHCYMQCARQHADDVNHELSVPGIREQSERYCRYWRHVIHAAQRCHQGCSEIRRAFGKPASKLRDELLEEIAAEEATYRAHVSCTEKAPFDNGVDFRK